MKIKIFVVLLSLFFLQNIEAKEIHRHEVNFGNYFRILPETLNEYSDMDISYLASLGYSYHPYPFPIAFDFRIGISLSGEYNSNLPEYNHYYFSFESDAGLLKNIYLTSKFDFFLGAGAKYIHSEMENTLCSQSDNSYPKHSFDGFGPYFKSGFQFFIFEAFSFTIEINYSNIEKSINNKKVNLCGTSIGANMVYSF
ncbi:MAG: hypothetical protein K8S23_06815 [Candidatus Cloacimonetes bacterium]|nr:hypothetical protein [Candidatus Cloacimonadota bacterium]